MKNKTTSEIDFGSVIKTYRKINNYTQEGLAEKLNITYQHLQRYESNKNNPPFPMLQKIIKILNIPPERFFSEIKNDELQKMKEEVEEYHRYIELIKKNPGLKDILEIILVEKDKFHQLNLSDFIKKLVTNKKIIQQYLNSIPG